MVALASIVSKVCVVSIVSMVSLLSRFVDLFYFSLKVVSFDIVYVHVQNLSDEFCLLLICPILLLNSLIKWLL